MVRQTLSYSGDGLFVVPIGVNELKIYAVGASGGAGNGFGVLLNNGGDGGTVVSNIKVYAGESLEIFVGVRGQDGGLPDGGLGGVSTEGFKGATAVAGKASGGGGGGGASGAIRVLGEELLVIAGGGGGGGGVGRGGLIGRGGAGGSFGQNGRGLAQVKVRHDHASNGDREPPESLVGGGGGGGGGGGRYGGGTGSDLDIQSSGAGVTGIHEGGLSAGSGGHVDALVVISFGPTSGLPEI